MSTIGAAFAWLWEAGPLDAIQPAQKRLLSAILALCIVLGCLATPLAIARAINGPAAIQALHLLLINIAAIIVLACAWLANRRGRVRLAKAVFMALCVAMMTVELLTDVLGTALASFSIPIIASAFLVMPVAALATSGLATLGYTVAHLARQTGQPYELLGVGALWVLGLLAWLIARQMAETLSAAHRSAEDLRADIALLEQAEAQLQELNQQLEARVALRTQALHESEQRFRRLAESAPDIIYRMRLTPSPAFEYISPRAESITGYAPQDFYDDPLLILSMSHRDDDAFTSALFAEQLALAEALDAVETRIQRRDGRIIWLEHRGTVLRGQDGAPVALEGIARDITERRQSEERMRLQRDLAIALNGAHNLNAAYRMVLEAICRIDGIDSGGVCRIDPGSGEVILTAHIGISDRMAAELARQPADSPQAKVNQAMKPVYLDRVHEMPTLTPVFAREGLRAAAIIPVSAGAGMSAQLVCSSHTLNGIPDGVRSTLEVIATQIGSSIAHITAEDGRFESQRNLQNLFDSLDDYLFILGGDGRILRTNPVVPQRLGYSTAELERMHVLDVHPTERRKEAADIVAAMLAGQVSFCPIPLRAKDGTLIPVETRVVPGQWSGKPVLFGISRDVSDRIRTMNALRESRAQLQRVLDGSNDGFWDWNVATGDVIFSQRWAEMLGYRLEEIKPNVTAWEALLHPDDQPSVERALADHLSGRTPQYVSEQRLRTRDGGWKWILDRGRVVERDAEGRATRMAGTHTDIAERRRAEDDLRQRGEFERLLATISANFISLPVDAIDDGIRRAIGQIGAFCAVDRSYIFLFDAERGAMSNTHEWCAPGIEPQIDHLQQLPIDSFPWWVEQLRANQAINLSRLSELPAEAGALRDMLELQDIQSLLAVPIWAQGKLIGHLGFDAVRSEHLWSSDAVSMIRFVADIIANALEHKDADQRIRAALAKEKELNDLKSSFVSNVSHEFRTPLTTILSSAEMLQHYADRLVPERKLRYLEQIQTSARNMTSLMDDVLTISRADNGRLACHPEPIDLPQFCRDLAEEVRLTSRGKRQIAFSNLGDCSSARMDEKLLRSILVNLLSNALKYSPDGSPVALDLDCRDGHAVFAVRDQGIGIPDEAQPRLFEPFFRAANIGSVAGTGLGLPIVKRSVDAHGGTIAVDSQLGVGSTFTVAIPLEPGNSQP